MPKHQLMLQNRFELFEQFEREGRPSDADPQRRAIIAKRKELESQIFSGLKPIQARALRQIFKEILEKRRLSSRKKTFDELLDELIQSASTRRTTQAKQAASIFQAVLLFLVVGGEIALIAYVISISAPAILIMLAIVMSIVALAILITGYFLDSKATRERDVDIQTVADLKASEDRNNAMAPTHQQLPANRENSFAEFTQAHDNAAPLAEAVTPPDHHSSPVSNSVSKRKVDRSADVEEIIEPSREKPPSGNVGREPPTRK